MEIAVFSDVHGNCIALNAVLADISSKSVDSMVCLGDAIQGGPQPAETVSRLRDLNIPTVMGNSDAWLLTGRVTSEAENITEDTLQVREWSLSKLSAPDRDFISKFPPVLNVPIERRTLVCFHGSPASFDDLIWPQTPDSDLAEKLGGYGNALLCGGHTHLQQIRRLGDSLYFNPGSVGYSFDHGRPYSEVLADPWAEYAVASCREGRVSIDFRRVPFDMEEMLRTIESSGMPNLPKRVARYRTRR